MFHDESWNPWGQSVKVTNHKNSASVGHFTLVSAGFFSLLYQVMALIILCEVVPVWYWIEYVNNCISAKFADVLFIFMFGIWRLHWG